MEPTAACICASVAVARAPLSDWMAPRNCPQLFSRPEAAVVQAAAGQVACMMSEVHIWRAQELTEPVLRPTHMIGGRQGGLMAPLTQIGQQSISAGTLVAVEIANSTSSTIMVSSSKTSSPIEQIEQILIEQSCLQQGDHSGNGLGLTIARRRRLQQVSARLSSDGQCKGDSHAGDEDDLHGCNGHGFAQPQNLQITVSMCIEEKSSGCRRVCMPLGPHVVLGLAIPGGHMYQGLPAWTSPWPTHVNAGLFAPPAV